MENLVFYIIAGKTSPPPVPKKKKTDSIENELSEEITNMVQSVTGRRKTVSHETGKRVKNLITSRGTDHFYSRNKTGFRKGEQVNCHSNI